ncbi:MAG: hypothetical protein MHM6MM_003216 [Cercozoa sp. M6MM]
MPHNLDELKETSASMAEVRRKQPIMALLTFSTAFLFKQAFSVPGSTLLNVTAGALYGTVRGFALSTILATLGSCCAYALSQRYGAMLLSGRCTGELNRLREMLPKPKQRRDIESGVSTTTSVKSELWLLLLSLRLLPVTPHALLNVLLPLLEVPILLFASSMCLGVAPYAYVSVSAGAMLAHVGGENGRILTPAFLIQVSVMSLLLCGLAILQRRRRVQQDESDHIKINTGMALDDEDDAVQEATPLLSQSFLSESDEDLDGQEFR